MENQKVLSEMSVMRIGEVILVRDREIQVKVDRTKNTSYLIYKGELIKNVSVGAYVKIAKGFLRLVAIVESETVRSDEPSNQEYHKAGGNIYRVLQLKLCGYIENRRYFQGVKEMPLIGNECYLMEVDEYNLIHCFAKPDEHSIHLGALLRDDQIQVELSVRQLFTNHIGIFGNTGSGKSYTLARLYHQLMQELRRDGKDNGAIKFILFDFNGEYSIEPTTIDSQKIIYNLSTLSTKGEDRIPLNKDDVLQEEKLSILANATEKTQKPFIKRALELYKRTYNTSKEDGISLTRTKIRCLIEDILKINDPVKGRLMLDFIKEIFHSFLGKAADCSYEDEISYHSKSSCYIINLPLPNSTNTGPYYMNDSSSFTHIKETKLYQKVCEIKDLPANPIDQFIIFMYLQLINDVLTNRASNEHIAPAINKLKAQRKDFMKLFNLTDSEDFWQGKTFVVINLNDCNTEMKKLVPMLICTKVYDEHKRLKGKSRAKEALNIIIDEAHNILSSESIRESETWKDYRLETFEEIIKEGRKFGVFLTIASQRPYDISPTIISQLHNYFIHRLVNDKDLNMVANNISYLDKLSVEMLPILPQGACVVAGLMTQLPVIVKVGTLSPEFAPQSQTIDAEDAWFDVKDPKHKVSHVQDFYPMLEHPLVKELQEKVSIDFNFYIKALSDLNSLLRGLGFAKVDVSTSPLYQWERHNDMFDEDCDTLTLTKDIFDDEGNLKNIRPSDWKEEMLTYQPKVSCHTTSFYDELPF